MTGSTEEQADDNIGRYEVLSRFFQYLYFIRFSIALWLFIPFLAFEDDRSSISALTRGIFTPALFGQFLGSAFFIVCVGMVALLTARLVCLNGKDRFVTPPPAWIAKSLGSDSDPWAGRVLLIVQSPGLLVILYLHWNARRELSIPPGIPDTHHAMPGSLSGIAIALLFWWVINAVHYWAYICTDAKGPARILLYPSWFFSFPYGLARAAYDATSAGDATAGRMPWVFAWPEKLWKLIAKLGPGYADSEGRLWEGHRLAAIALAGYIAIYIVLFPLTAPAPQDGPYREVLGGVAALAALLSIAIFITKPARHPFIRFLSFVLMVTFAILGLWAFVWMFKTPFSFQGFPILGSILVLTTMLAFILSATAFWADRHRIPVLTSFILYLYISHNLVSQSAEPYFHALELKTVSTPPTPAEIFRLHRSTCKGAEMSAVPCPVILVTATGGGIHAAAWTAVVLTELELKMQNDGILKKRAVTFHDQLLYISAVSGGSVGAIPFLREYYSHPAFSSKDEIANTSNPSWLGRIRRAANCSSLEAVGWGLEYSDFLHLVNPFLAADPHRDRSVALEQALARNITSRNCDTSYPDDSGIPVDALTLAGMVEDLKHGSGKKRLSHLPAFTFNTTAAETGGRFLLANYVNPGVDNVTEDPYDYGVPPAESFLSAYGVGESKGRSADIELVTAARLSATFPYVSSAARIDPGFAPGAYHFVDGGYIDNDGTSSAIEFLESAFKGRTKLSADDSVPILFIEIRDSSDLDIINEESFIRQQPSQSLADAGPVLWSLSDQLAAPLLTFWQSGHVSVTRRNRRELESLMSVLSDAKQASFTHIVFDYTDPDAGPKLRHSSAQPLSWHLTPLQVSNLSAAIVALQPCTQDVIHWAQRSPRAAGGSPSVICNYQLATSRSASSK